MYEHVATILPNVTRFAAGRRLLLQPGRGLLQALASQLRSGSELRRRGCAGAIKNCCFSCEADGTAGDIVAEGEVRAGRGSTQNAVVLLFGRVLCSKLCGILRCLAACPSVTCHVCR